ncbi:MAG: hypothetical protein U0M70_06520 [Eubacteriales bacterium]
MHRWKRPEKAFAWILEDIRPIEPIPIKGRLSLFEVDVNPVFLPRTCDITDEEADAIVWSELHREDNYPSYWD